jgi:hypothetical protein
VENRLATKQDMVLLQRDIKELEISLKCDTKEIAMRIAIRLGLMMATAIAIVDTLVKLL